MSDITKEFASNLDGEAVWISSFDDGTAAELADDFIDRVIATLRRDPRWSSLEPSELALFFADLRRVSRKTLTLHSAAALRIGTSASVRSGPWSKRWPIGQRVNELP